MRESSGCGETEEEPRSEQEETPAGPAVARMQSAMSSFRNYLEKCGGARVKRCDSQAGA